MIEMGDKPDWKCVFTYVQSLYKHFVYDASSNGSPEQRDKPVVIKL